MRSQELDMTLLDDVAGLEWMARRLAKGLMAGRHASQKLGRGMEFTQYRSYVQGDDLRLLDWKMYAKTGKYFIRQSDIESDHSLHIDLDDSKSMEYQEDGFSKFKLSKLITATLTYVMAQQLDDFSWQSGGLHFTRGRGLKTWRRSLQSLHDLMTSSDETLKTSFDRVGRILWITDLYYELGDIKERLQQYLGPGRELTIFHIVGKKEENLSFGSNTKFVDLESREEMQVDASRYVDDYKEAYHDHISKVKHLCLIHEVIYKRIYLQSDLVTELRTFITDYNAMTVR